jgi:hypothetical protein
MKKLITIFAVVTMILSISGAAQAATITYTDTQTIYPGEPDSPYPTGFFTSIPQFNPSLGALNSVTVKVTGTTTATLKFNTLTSFTRVAARANYYNEWVLSYYYDAQGNPQGDYTLDGNGNPIAARSEQQPLTIGWSTGGIVDPNTWPSYTKSWGPFQLPDTNKVYTSPADLADFTGTGIAPLSVAYDADFSIWTKGGNNNWTLSTIGTFNASVTYDYEPTTAITLASFEAKPGSGKVTLIWETATEIDNAGFNIYRAEAENGEYIQINSSLIPAKGSSTQGASYEFVDTDVKNRKTYYYKLEDIDLNGTSTMHGPKSATPRWILGKFGIFKK